MAISIFHLYVHSLSYGKANEFVWRRSVCIMDMPNYDVSLIYKGVVQGTGSKITILKPELETPHLQKWTDFLTLRPNYLVVCKSEHMELPLALQIEMQELLLHKPNPESAKPINKAIVS